MYFSCFRTSSPVLERPFPVLKCPFLVFWESDFVLGRPWTEEFVPGFLLLPMSRDKGTTVQENIFVPGQWDVPSRIVPGRLAGRPIPWKPYHVQWVY